MDNTQLITVAAVVLANIGTVLGLFMWATTRADTALNNNRVETQAFLKAIADEMKDFHGRLCAIEERNSTRVIK